MRKLVVVFLLMASLVGAHHAQAAPTKPPRGITLSPAIVNTSVTASETDHEVDFTLTNNENADLGVNLSTRDFNTLNETGGLFFVGANPSQLQKKYGLANWLSLPQSQYNIPAKQSVSVKAVVLNQPTLAPGGHYGALMVNLNKPGAPASGQNQVSLQPIASALLFVNKVGGELYHLKLTSVEASHTFWKLPNQATLRFQNTGNTHLVPRGVVDIYGPENKLVSHGVINDSSGIILPETARRYSVPLTKVSSASAPGKYKLVVNWRFDGINQYRAYQSSFLFAPILSLVLILLLAGIIVLAFRRLSWCDLRSLAIYIKRLPRRFMALVRTTKINGLGFTVKLLSARLLRKQAPRAVMLSKADKPLDMPAKKTNKTMRTKSRKAKKIDKTTRRKTTKTNR